MLHRLVVPSRPGSSLNPDQIKRGNGPSHGMQETRVTNEFGNPVNYCTNGLSRGTIPDLDGPVSLLREALEASHCLDGEHGVKILHIICNLNPEVGGPPEAILRQSRVWQELGHSCEIASLDFPDDSWVLNCPFTVFALGLRSSLWRQLQIIFPLLRYSYSPYLVPWLRCHAINYDIILVHGLWNYVALGAVRSLVRSNIPYFIFPHGALDPWYKRAYPIKNIAKKLLWLFSEGRLLKGAAGVLFTTEEEKTLARGAFYPWHARELVVDFGTADIEGIPEKQIKAFLDRFPELRGKKFLVFVGRIHPKKGCDVLLRSFAMIAQKHSDLSLVMVGPDQIGWRKELELLASSIGIGDRIYWTGMLYGDEKWGAYRGAVAFVLASHTDNFGLVVAEALCCGIPVLITNKVNIWREISERKAGFVADNNEAAFAGIMEQFFRLNPEERSEMGALARSLFLDRFEASVAAKRMLEKITAIGLAGQGKR